MRKAFIAKKYVNFLSRGVNEKIIKYCVQNILVCFVDNAVFENVAQKRLDFW